MSDEELNLPALSTGEQAYLMKMSGLSLSEISAQLNVNTTTVASSINLALKREASYLTQEDRDDILAMENNRLDYYLSKLWDQIQYGDVRAILAALQIHDRKMKANRLDQPTSVQNNQVLVIGGDQADYLQRLKQVTDG